MTLPRTRIDRRSFLIGSGALVLAACSSDSKTSSGAAGTATITTSKDGYGLVPRFDRALLVPGTVRMPFSLSKDQAVLSDGPKSLTAKIVDSSNKVVVPSMTAKQRRVNEAIVYWDFHPDLPTVGEYTMFIDGGDLDGSALSINDPASVKVPYIGQQLPPFDTPTTKDPRGVNPICTRLTGGPCPFHDITLTDALKQGKPVAYLIGTPAHCQFGTCAPALEALITSSKRLGDKLVVVHAEVYTDDTTTTTAPAVDAYNLSGEPDMWLADKTGKIVTRFEGAWDQTELDEALNSLTA